MTDALAQTRAAATASGRALQLQLLIKNPYNPNIDVVELAFEFDAGTRVADLKHALMRAYPTNPPVAKQRLIFFGKLLGDAERCADVFARADLAEAQTLHLLIPIDRDVDVTTEAQPEETTEEEPDGDWRNEDGIRNVAALAGISGAAAFADGAAHADGAQLFGADAPLPPHHQQQAFRDAYTLPAQLAHAGEAPMGWHDGFAMPFGLAGQLLGTPFGGGPAALALLREELDNMDDGAGAAPHSLSDGVSSATRPVVLGASDDDMDSDGEWNRVPRPESYEECVAQLQHHYTELMRAVDAAQQLQAAAVAATAHWPYAGPAQLQPSQQLQQQQARRLPRPRATAAAPERARQAPAAPAAREAVPDLAAAAGAPDAADMNPGLPEPRARVVVINVRLLIKLAFVLYLVGHDASAEQFYAMLALAATYYLYDSGYLEFLLGSRQQQTDALARLRLHELGHISTAERVAPGLLADGYFFAKAFVLSLAPAWAPVPHPPVENANNN